MHSSCGAPMTPGQSPVASPGQPESLGSQSEAQLQGPHTQTIHTHAFISALLVVTRPQGKLPVQKYTQGSDWWWQLRFGMCYYKLGLFQEAIRQHEKSLELYNMDETVMHLNKCYLRIDQPLIAAKMFSKLAEKNPGTRDQPRFSHLLCSPLHGSIMYRSVNHVWQPPRIGKWDEFIAFWKHCFGEGCQLRTALR